MNWIVFPDCDKCNGTNHVVILDYRGLDKTYHYYPSMEKQNES